MRPAERGAAAMNGALAATSIPARGGTRDSRCGGPPVEAPLGGHLRGSRSSPGTAVENRPGGAFGRSCPVGGRSTGTPTDPS